MQSPSLFKAIVKSRGFPSGFVANSSPGRSSGAGKSAAADGCHSSRSAHKSSSGASSSKPPAKVCMCAPTKHPGSFRCRFHRRQSATQAFASTGSKSCISPPHSQPPLGSRAPSPLPPAAPRASGLRQGARLGPSRLSRVSTASSLTDEAESAFEGPFRFLRSAAVPAGAAVAAGGTAVGWRKNCSSAPKGKLGPGFFIRQFLLSACCLLDAPLAPAAGSSFNQSAYYDVQPGDNLSSISKKLGTTVEVLRESNALRTDLLQPGQKLWVPKTHTIQKGDTLFKIAKENGTTVGDLLKVNNISNPDKIYPGDVLLLP